MSTGPRPTGALDDVVVVKTTGVDVVVAGETVMVTFGVVVPFADDVVGDVVEFPTAVAVVVVEFGSAVVVAGDDEEVPVAVVVVDDD